MAEDNNESGSSEGMSEEELLYFERIVARVRADGVVVNDCCKGVAKSVFKTMLDDAINKKKEEARLKREKIAQDEEDEEFVKIVMSGWL